MGKTLKINLERQKTRCIHCGGPPPENNDLKGIDNISGLLVEKQGMDDFEQVIEGDLFCYDMDYMIPMVNYYPEQNSEQIIMKMKRDYLKNLRKKSRSRLTHLFKPSTGAL